MAAKATEHEIRNLLRTALEARYGGGDTLILDELAVVQGAARIDMAVVNGSLSGYEIKSDRDTLDRLPRQRVEYGRCFDTLTLVVGSKHVAAAFDHVPGWWGIDEAKLGTAGLELVEHRPPQGNPNIEPVPLLQLLWKAECLSLLEERGLADGIRSKRQAVLVAKLAERPLDEVRAMVRDALKARGDWRAGPSPFQRGGSCQSAATARDSRARNLEWLLSAGSQRHPR